jgi:hypothetical protein
VLLEDVKKIIIALLRSADYCSIAFPEDDITLCFRTEDNDTVCIGLNFHGLHDAEIVKEIDDCITRWRKQEKQIK